VTLNIVYCTIDLHLKCDSDITCLIATLLSNDIVAPNVGSRIIEINLTPRCTAIKTTGPLVPQVDYTRLIVSIKLN
jgi:hypothetical protein